jgi:hypothetical protein
MKALITSLAILFSCLCFGQDENIKPDYKKIEKAIKKENTPLFYDTLFSRFLRGDTTMTVEEKQHLYFGYQFKENYSPYGDSDYSDSLKELYKKDKLTETDYKLGLRFIDSVLKNEPFNMRKLNIGSKWLMKTGDTLKSGTFSNRINIIFDAILSTGDGKTPETAYYVIAVSHEYDVLSVLDFEFGGEQSLIGHNDYLKVKKNDYGIEGLYFDITAPFNTLSKMFKK